MELLQEGVDLVKSFEGFQPTAYLCPAGVPTIGYGHTKGVTISDVSAKKTISKAEAETLLAEDLTVAGNSVRDLVNVGLSNLQFSALCSFVFNVGKGNLSSSTMLKLLNQAKFIDAAAQFDVWVKATVEGKKVTLAGLVKRRAAEKHLFLQGTDSGSGISMPQAVESDAGA